MARKSKKSSVIRKLIYLEPFVENIFTCPCSQANATACSLPAAATIIVDTSVCHWCSPQFMVCQLTQDSLSRRSRDAGAVEDTIEMTRAP